MPSRAALCIGESMAQLVPLGGKPVESAGSFQVRVAGAESNVAIGLAQLGHDAAWLSRLGDDALGRRVAHELAESGVDIDDVVFDPERRTGLFVKEPRPTGSTVVYYRDGSAASALAPDDVERALTRDPSVVHVSGVTPALSDSCLAATEHAVFSSRPAERLLSFDVNYRPVLWRDRASAADHLLRLAAGSDVVFVGLDEAAALWDVETPDDCRALLPRVSHLVVKNDGGSAVEYSASPTVWQPARPVSIVEPIGAGDAFASGWLHGRLTGRDAAVRLRLGHLMAARALTSFSDHSGAAIDIADLHTRAENGWTASPTAY